MRWMVKNSDGKLDSMLTFAVIGFLVCMAKFIVHNLSFTYGEFNIDFGAVDAALIGAVLTPTLVAYCSRRYTDAKYKVNGQETKNKDVATDE